MLDQSETTARETQAGHPVRPARLPVPASFGRVLVLLAVFICAACGLVYELELVALASYLVGDSVTQASVVLSVMVFAMGVGSLLAKRWKSVAAAGFAVIEVLLALIGGLSAFALYACFAWFGESGYALVAFSCAIGVLTGAEMPLLMMLIQRIRRQDPGGVVADLFAADYVGALVGGLAFPFLLLPRLGQLDGALLTGAVNAVAGGGVVLWLFRSDLSLRSLRWLCAANAAALGILAVAAVFAGPFEGAARHAIYGFTARHAGPADGQQVVLTGSGPHGLRLYLDGRLRASGADEFRFHEALVHPAMAGPHRRVLVLGGGDGLALREVLRYPTVRAVTVIAVDPDLLRLGRTDPGLSALNRHSLEDRRVRAVAADPFDWMRTRARAGAYDVVLTDLPDPDISRNTKLYSQEFYGLARRALAGQGRMVLYAGAPDARPGAFWSMDASIRAAGLRTTAYEVGGRRFLLAARHGPALRLDARVPPLRSLTAASLRRAGELARARPRQTELPSTLMHPRYFG